MTRTASRGAPRASSDERWPPRPRPPRARNARPAASRPAPATRALVLRVLRHDLLHGRALPHSHDRDLARLRRGGRARARGTGGGGGGRTFLLCARTVIMPSSSSPFWLWGLDRSVFSTSRRLRELSRWPTSSPPMPGRMTKPGADDPEATESASRTEKSGFVPVSLGVWAVLPSPPKPDMVSESVGAPGPPRPRERPTTPSRVSNRPPGSSQHGRSCHNSEWISFALPLIGDGVSFCGRRLR